MDVTILGSGNVATHLGEALSQAGHRIIQVYSRTEEHARTLAERLGANAITDIGQLDARIPLYIIAVSDDAIPSLVDQLPQGLPGMVVHTSGTTSIATVSSLPRHGVFYPLQTFSKAKTVDFRSVPLALEAGDADGLALLTSLANTISDTVFPCDSAQRLSLHVAAVFASNFTNHLYAVAAAILARKGLSFDLIKPLVTETASKVQTLDPVKAQTGPAVRNDRKTMGTHLEFLRDDPEWKQLYEILSSAILQGTKFPLDPKQ